MKYSILILLGVRAQVAEYQDICMNKLFYFEVLGLDEIYEILVEFVILRKRRKLRKFYFQKHGLGLSCFYYDATAKRLYYYLIWPNWTLVRIR